MFSMGNLFWFSLLCCMVELVKLSSTWSWCLDNSALLSTNSWCYCKVTTFSDFVKKQSLTSNIYNYQVVIDAGSTGTRVHVFTFHRTLTGMYFYLMYCQVYTLLHTCLPSGELGSRQEEATLPNVGELHYYCLLS